jgi:peptidoglycan/LPS O-acetylase OafA/YrhL
MGQATRKSETYTALNGLRFLAALAVVFFHFAPKVEGYEAVPAVLRKLIQEGPAAVGFFFILSGFILASRYLQKSTGVEDVRAFYWARFARLYPAYLVGFLLFAPIAAQKYLVHSSAAEAGPRTFALSGALYCLMLQAWTPLAQAWNGPSWSLSVEAFMYAVFPWIAATLVRFSRRSTMLVIFLAWLVPLSIVAAYASHLISPATWHTYVVNNPLLWLPLFVMGVCAIKMLPAWRNVENNRANLVQTACFLVVVLVGLAWPGVYSEVLVVGGIAPLLLALVVCFTTTSGWLSKFLGGETFNTLGQASYIIYIIQSPVWHYWQGLTNRARGLPMETPAVNQWQFLLFLPVLIFVSLAVERFIEVPARGWLIRRRAANVARHNSSEARTPEMAHTASVKFPRS